MDSGSVFARFQSFDFEADRRFVDGVSSLNCLKDGTKVLDLKLFFYNRFVEPIDRPAYRQWSAAAVLPPIHSDLSIPSDGDVGVPSDGDVGVPSDGDVGVPSDGGVAGERLSFSEVMRLVHEGQEVPGVKKLDVEPSNRSATPSQRSRLLKPWESSPS